MELIWPRFWKFRSVFLKVLGFILARKNLDEKDQNFNVLGGFQDQFQPSEVDFLGVLDFPLHSLYKCKGKSSKSADFGLSGKIPNSNRPISANF